MPSQEAGSIERRYPAARSVAASPSHRPREIGSLDRRYPAARSAVASPSSRLQEIGSLESRTDGPEPPRRTVSHRQQEIGSLERVGIKEVWPNESADFTRWLKEHIGELDRFLGLGMTGVRSEVRVGDFRCDLVAGSDGGDIVIESQFGRTDDRRLDQLVRCLSDPAVQRAVWIVELVGAEHVKAVRALNRRSAGQFWLVQVVAVRIGRSQPAPLFTIVVRPSEDAPDDPVTGSDSTRTEGPLLKFWAALIQRARYEGIESMFGNLAAKPQNALDIGTCQPGLVYRLVANRLRSRVVFTNSKSGEWMDAYSVLDASREDIDQKFACHGLPRQLEWEPAYRPGRWFIRYVVPAGWASTEDVSKLGELAKAAAAMKQVLDPYLRNLDPNLQQHIHKNRYRWYNRDNVR